MARFLFVVPPLTGHVNPTVSVGETLASRGQQVAWVGHPSRVRSLLPEGGMLFDLDEGLPREFVEEKTAKARKVRGLAAFKFRWEEFFFPLARSMVPGVEEACGRFEPDLLVVDQQTLAGALAARRLGLPWATLATTSAGVTDPLGGLPRVKEWVADSFAALEEEHGLEPGGPVDASPRAVVVFSTEALVGPTSGFPQHYSFVGPAIGRRPEPTPFPWEELEERPRVLVSLGTVNVDRGARFYRTASKAMAGVDAQFIIVASRSLLPSLPANCLVRERVPQLALLPHLNAVLSHGGHNTVCETLAHGLPLVLTPIKDDQQTVAGQVVKAGAGIRLKFARLRGEDLRAALTAVLQEPGYRDAARLVGESFAAAGGEEAAADALERAAIPGPGRDGPERSG